jgi:hypothetical protein
VAERGRGAGKPAGAADADAVQRAIDVSVDVTTPLIAFSETDKDAATAETHYGLLFAKDNTVTTASYGCGFDDPGSWQAGTYTVDFLVGPLKIARVFFGIY